MEMASGRLHGCLFLSKKPRKKESFRYNSNCVAVRYLGVFLRQSILAAIIILTMHSPIEALAFMISFYL